MSFFQILEYWQKKVEQKESKSKKSKNENEISNYNKAEDLDKNNTRSSTDDDTVKTEEDEDTDYHHDAQGMENDYCHDAWRLKDDICQDHEEFHCNLCFYDGKPIKIVTNHKEGCPTCPTMTPEQKVVKIGPNWKSKAERIFQIRFQRKQDGRGRSYADSIRTSFPTWSYHYAIYWIL